MNGPIYFKLDTLFMNDIIQRRTGNYLIEKYMEYIDSFQRNKVSQIKVNLESKKIFIELPHDCIPITIEDEKEKIDLKFQICIKVPFSEITFK